MGPCGRDLVYRLALHQPVLHNAEHGLPDHLRVAALWRAPTQERELLTRRIQAGKLQQRGVHLAMALPLLPQPDPIPGDGVGAGVGLQRVGIAEDGGSPHIDPVAVMVLVDDGDHGMLLSCPHPSGRERGVGGVSHRAVRAPHPHTRLCGPAVGVHPAPRRGRSRRVVRRASTCPESPCRAAPTRPAPPHSRLPEFLRSRDRSA